MFLFSKEKKVTATLKSHLNKVKECLELTYQTVQQYFKGQIEEAKELAISVDQAETEADVFRREITDMLYGGAFLPTIRQDILALVAQMDDVANAAETACDFLLGERPEIPAKWYKEMFAIYEKTLDQFHHIMDAINVLVEKTNAEIEMIREHNRNVGIMESEIDEIEWHLTREIFRSELELARKIHLRTWLRLSSQLSDQIENLSDTLNVLVLKSKI